MNSLALAVLIFQTISSTLAVVFNTFLVFIISHYTKNKLGFYKTILIIYACFEGLFAMVIIIGEPIHYITRLTWIGLNIMGPLFGTSFSKMGPLLYCFFYEIWIGFVVFNFVYRWFCVCREKWVRLISGSRFLKLILFILIVVYIIICFVCSHFFCTSNEMSKELTEEVVSHFGVNITQVGYVIRIMKDDGSLSLAGINAVLFHIIPILLAAGIISICAWKISRAIKYNLMRIHDFSLKKVNVSLERQLFLSLLLQASIPMIFFMGPFILSLTYPIFSKDFSLFVTISPILSLSMSLPKMLDPIITIVCVAEYRRAVFGLFRKPAASTTNALVTTITDVKNVY